MDLGHQHAAEAVPGDELQPELCFSLLGGSRCFIGI